VRWPNDEPPGCDTRETPEHVADAGDDELATAYRGRTKQLHEARSALAEAVSVLESELANRREESLALRAELDGVTADNRSLHEAAASEREQEGRRIAILEDELRRARAELEVLRGMKVIRWTAWPRRLVYGLRARQK
jgi:predicted RNase H-like nuclease (RuvC/YqgF family)